MDSCCNGCEPCRVEVAEAVFQDVRYERAAQDAKWGDQSGNDDLLWVAVHGEELGEVIEANLVYRYGKVCQAALSQITTQPKETDADCLYDELIQLAATCVAHAEALRVRGVR